MRILVPVLFLLLTGCMVDSPPPRPAPATEATEATDESPSAADRYDPMNRANAVEGDIMEDKEATDSAIEAQGGSI